MAKFYITTAIDYINGKPHMGHAYEKIGTDVAARYHRMKGDDTYFVTGTDEHSLNVLKKAQEEGLDPKTYCDGMAKHFVELCRVLSISYDRFIRTTDEDHERTVQAIVQKAWDRGYIYKGSYSGYYCESCEAFLDEDALVEGKCPFHPTKEVKWLKEENYFFALSKFQDRLLKYIEENPLFIQPEARKNEVVNRIKEGLKDVSISRSTMQWGVTFPMDPSHVVYVWFDALINYVTAAGYATNPELYGKYWPADYHIIGKDITWFHCVIWPATLMALDMPLPKNVFAHGFVNVKGQRMSKSSGLVVDPFDLVNRFGVDVTRYYLMRAIPWGQDGDFAYENLVTTYNNDLANDFGNLLSRTTAMINKYFEGVVPAPGGSEPIDKEIVSLGKEVLAGYVAAMDDLRYSDALADLFRLINRANKYIEETAPWELAKTPDKRSRLGTVMYNLAEVLRIGAVGLSPFMPNAPVKVWNQLGLEGEPGATGAKLAWGGLKPGTKINRGEPLFPRMDVEEVMASLNAVMASLNASRNGDRGSVSSGKVTSDAQSAKQGSVERADRGCAGSASQGSAGDHAMTGKASQAGEAAGKLVGQVEGKARTMEDNKAAHGQAVDGTKEGARDGATKEAKDVAKDEAEGVAKEGADASAPELVSIDDFAKIQLRVGKVIEAKQHENANKLLVLRVDIGTEVRQIVAGIAKHYTPEELVGKSIIIVANLKPARLRGVESQGMLLAASNADDTIVRVLTPDGPVEPGSRVR